MKTTLDISDDLMKSIKTVAKNKNVTLKEIVEISLRDYLATHSKSSPKKKWVRHHFGSGGLVEDLQDKPWSEIRDIAYQRHP